MDAGQLLVALGGAGTIIGTLSGLIFKLQTARIIALELENTTLRNEIAKAVDAKDAEIATLRDIAANLAVEKAKEAAWNRANP